VDRFGSVSLDSNRSIRHRMYSKVVLVTIVGVTAFVLALDLLFSRPPV
jgi:hypothetical protein